MKNDYNGWANRETWLVNVWLGDYFSEVALDGQHRMADYIESTVYDMLDDADMPDMFKDFIDLGCVDYRALADHYTTADAVAHA